MGGPLSFRKEQRTSGLSQRLHRPRKRQRRPLFELLEDRRLLAADSLGKEFWLAFERNFDNAGVTPTLFITGPISTAGRVEIPGISYSQDFTVTPGTVTSINVPTSVLVSADDGVADLGIHISSNEEISVYGLNLKTRTTDAYLGLPVDILGTEYIVMSSPTVGTTGNNASQFAVVAIADDTSITITPSTAAGSRVAGVPFTVPLNQGQVYHLSALTTSADLTGTIITSDKPVAVFGGNRGANMPVGFGFADHLVEQLTPVVTWGRDFVTMPLATRLKGDPFRIVAAQDGTEIEVNNAIVATLNRGQFFQTILTGPSKITASKPIMVAQYSAGTEFDGVISDPFMSLVAPVEQLLTNYTLSTPAAGFRTNYINIVAPQQSIASILVDGVAIPPTNFVAISDSGFVGTQVPVALGTHTVESNSLLGVTIYGFDDHDSYGYAGGMSLVPIGTIASLGLTPETTEDYPGVTHTFTARVLDDQGNPLLGARVDFVVTGANPQSAFAYTAFNGEATFSYSGVNSGADMITASVAGFSDHATVDWLAYPDLAPSNVSFPSSGTRGQSINIGFDVLNSGAGPAQRTWTDAVYFSKDQLLDANDVLVGTASNPASVAASASYHQSFAYAIPSELALGPYYLLVRTDRDNTQVESNESNNIAAFPFEVTAPDLIPSNIQAPPSANPGETLSLSWTLTNLGGSSATGPWTEKVYLSSDRPFGYPVNGLLAAWTAEGNANASVGAIDGTLQGGTTFSNGLFGQAFNFNGSDAYVQFGQHAVPTSGSYTVSLLERQNASQADYIELISQGATFGPGFYIGHDPNGNIRVSDSWQNTGVAFPLDNQWHHIVVTVDAAANVTKLYVDGFLRNTLNSAIATTSGGTHTRLGKQYEPAGEFFNGAIDEVRIYGRALTDSEIATAAAPALLSGNAVNIGTFTIDETLAPGQSIVVSRSVTIPNTGRFTSGDLYFAVVEDAGGILREVSEANNVAISDATIHVPVLLSLVPAVTSVNENVTPATVGFTVARTGDLAAPLEVALASDSTLLTVPATVTIPAGQASATFNAGVVHDGLVTPDHLVQISASAAGLSAAMASINIKNTDTPILSFSLDLSQVTEGGAVVATITRNALLDSALSVTLTEANAVSALPQFALPPLAFTIGEQTVTVTLPTIQDTLIEKNKPVTLTAAAVGFANTTAAVTVVDDDLPNLTLSVVPTMFSEGAGTNAAVGHVTRAVVTDQPLTVKLVSSNTAKLTVPTTVVIPANQDSVTFAVGAVDNLIPDGTAMVTVSANGAYPECGCTILAGAASTIVKVLDNEQPALQLTLSKSLVYEDSGSEAAIGTIVRLGTDNETDLVVTLSSSDTTGATVPATVVIPAGQSSATFPVAAVPDNATAGNKLITIGATALGLVSGSAQLTVTDIDLPDLIVSAVAATTNENPPSPIGNTLSDTGFYATYTVKNQGRTTVSGTWSDRVYISADSAAGNDVLVGTYSITATLAPGQSYSRTVPVQGQTKTGNYWIVATTDLAEQVTEFDETNNTSLASSPVQVSAEYNVTVSTNVNVALAGTNVPLSGHAALASDGSPAAFKLVNLHILVRGTERIISAITNAAGDFSATFKPLPGEAGDYTIFATHPGVPTGTVQDTFTLIGLASEPPTPSISVVEGSEATGQVTLRNLSQVALTNLSISVSSKPANVQVALQIGDNTPNPTLAGDATTTLKFTVTAQSPTPASGSIVLHVTTAEGAAIDIPVSVQIVALAPHLAAAPGQLAAGMLRGMQTLVEFTLTNDGGRETGPLTLSLPNVPWLSAVTPLNMASIPVGGSAQGVVQLTPPANLPLGDYTGQITLNGAGVSLAVPFTFRALSNATGSLLIDVQDEYTFFADGNPHVAGASVKVFDAIDHTQIAAGTTSADGQFAVPTLREGYYDIEVTADKHDSYKATVLISPSETKSVQAFLARRTVSYTWSVVPSQVVDRTEVILETTFETNVPVPVVTVERLNADGSTSSPFIDLEPLNFIGASMQVDFRISNHGLIAANDVALNFGTHPFYEITPLIPNAGILPPMSSITIPVTIRRVADFDNSSVQSGSSGSSGGTVALARSAAAESVPCSIPAGVIYFYICGPNGVVREVPIYFNGVKGSCTPPLIPPLPTISGGQRYEPTERIPTPTVRVPTVVETLPATCTCLETKYTVGVSKGGYLSGAAKRITSIISDALSFIPDLDVETDFSLGGEASLTHCCENNAPAGWKFEASGGGEVSTTLKIGPQVKPLSFEAGGYTVEAGLTGFAGIVVKGFGSLTGNFETECDFEKPKGVVSLSAGVSGGLSIEVGAALTFKKNDEIVGGGEAEGSATLQLKADISGKAIFQGSLVPRIEVEGNFGTCELVAQLKFTLPNDVEVTESVTFKLFDGFSFTRPVATAAGVAAARSLNSELDEPIEIISLDDLAAGLGYSSAATLQQALGMSNLPTDLQATLLSNVLNAQLELENAAKTGVCAQVGLELTQDAVQTRDAFTAMLTVNNGQLTPLTDVKVDLFVRDEAGNIVNSLFGIQAPQLNQISAVDGTGVINASTSGSASWTVIPSLDASSAVPKKYSVSGVLRYTDEGLPITVTLTPVDITVYPQPELYLDYFLQRDVFSDDPHTPQIEASQPFELDVMVNNRGDGAAANLQLQSAQPQIVDNEKGLLINFQIIATEILGEGGNLTPSLTANFGTVDPGEIKIGRWYMASTLQGLFTDYKASFRHVSDLGNPRLSLIQDVKIHELIHAVRDFSAGADALPDFLTNDDRDINAVPDKLYLSDGTTAPVSLFASASFDGTPNNGDLQVQLTVPVGAGWQYLNIADLGNGQFRLARVLRSDGKELPLENFWQTDRTFIGQGKPAVRENNLHLLDKDTTGSYTLVYAKVVQPAPTAAIAAVDTPRTASIDSMSVNFSKAVTGVALNAFTLSRNGGPNLLTAAQSISTSDNIHYAINNLAALTADPGIYTLSLHASGSGIVDSVGTPLASDASNTFQVFVPGVITGRHVFYNNSSYDGNDPTANGADDAAIAMNKQALLPGQTATFANYTSYNKGLNGVMVDVSHLSSTLSTGDFLFRVGNGDNVGAWSNAPAPISITVRSGAGVDGADRATIIWADGAISGEWLQVTMLANANTGLVAPDVFYFGNAIGESGNSMADAAVTSADVLAVRGRMAGSPPAPLDSPYDFDRNGVLNTLDMQVAQQHLTAANTVLNLIHPTLPQALVQPGLTGDYNNDGSVDAADYVLWRKNQGKNATLPNDSTPGNVGQDDFLTWRNHFGQSAGQGSSSSLRTLVHDTTLPQFSPMRRPALMAESNSVMVTAAGGHLAVPLTIADTAVTTFSADVASAPDANVAADLAFNDFGAEDHSFAYPPSSNDRRNGLPYDNGSSIHYFARNRNLTAVRPVVKIASDQSLHRLDASAWGLGEAICQRSEHQEGLRVDSDIEDNLEGNDFELADAEAFDLAFVSI